MARAKSQVLSKDEIKAVKAEAKEAIKASKLALKEANAERKTLDKEYNTAVKASDKTIAGLEKEVAKAEATLTALEPAVD